VQPEIPLDKWSLTLDAQWKIPATRLTPKRAPQSTSERLHCVTTWSKTTVGGCGAPSPPFTSSCNPKRTLRFVLFQYDGYSTNVALEKAWTMMCSSRRNLTVLPSPASTAGPPAISPKLYAWKGAEIVQAITFLDTIKWVLGGSAISNSADRGRRALRLTAILLIIRSKPRQSHSFGSFCKQSIGWHEWKSESGMKKFTERLVERG